MKNTGEISNDQFLQLRSECSDAKKQLLEVESEKEKLTEDRQTLCNEVMELNHKISALQVSVIGSGGSEKTLQGEIDAQQLTVSGLNSSIEALVADNDSLSSQLESANEVVETWKERALEAQNVEQQVSVRETRKKYHTFDFSPVYTKSSSQMPLVRIQRQRIDI